MEQKTNEETKSKSKLLMKILGIIVLILIGIGGYMIYDQVLSNDVNENNELEYNADENGVNGYENGYEADNENNEQQNNVVDLNDGRDATVTGSLVRKRDGPGTNYEITEEVEGGTRLFLGEDRTLISGEGCAGGWLLVVCCGEQGIAYICSDFIEKD